MSKRIRYSDEPIEAEIIPDFLPPPEQLVLAERTVRITISLSPRGVEFFKLAAERHQTSCQRMIRRVLDFYADRYGGHRTKPGGGRSSGSRR